MKDWKLP